jgi:PIN domain nuclease of toxin-antitoxin system
VTGAVITDLAAFVWWGLGKPQRLGPAGVSAFERADAGIARIFVPTVVLDQLAAAAEAGLVGLDAPLAEFIERLFNCGAYAPAPLTPEIVARAGAFPASVPRGDRLLVATAAVLGCPLLSARAEIGRWSGIRLVW